MLLLALETTSHHGSAALLRDGELLGSTLLDARQYSTRLWNAMDALLDAAGVTRRAIEALAVAHGPGSFTGVRLGLSTAKAMLEARPLAAVPVSTLAAVAALGAGAVASTAPIVAALDASRGECYLGIYPRGALHFALQPAPEEERDGVELLLPVAAAASRVAALGWPAWTPHPALATTLGETVQVGDLLLAPWIGRLGHRLLGEGRGVDALRLDANYIRRSDAELFRKP